MARTIEDLRQMQSLPLELKVTMTKARIRQWVNEYGEDGGLNYKAVIDWLNENGGLNIKY